MIKITSKFTIVVTEKMLTTKKYFLLPFSVTNYDEGNCERQSFISPRLATLYLTTNGKSFSR